MKYYKTAMLSNGKELILRGGEAKDGQAVFDVFLQTHSESDFLLSYPEENNYDAAQEADYLQKQSDSSNAIEVLAIVDNKLVGIAGIEAIGSKYKVRHRADLGISVLKDYWGLGIGRLLMESCIDCAKTAGYSQIELDVVADNQRAISLYRHFGFVEFARNPRGFNSKVSGYQELLSMRLELS